MGLGRRPGADGEVQGVSGSFSSRVGQEGSAGSRVWVLVQRQFSKWHIWLREAGQSGGRGWKEGASRGSDQAASQPPSQACEARGVAIEAVQPSSSPTADPGLLGAHLLPWESVLQPWPRAGATHWPPGSVLTGQGRRSVCLCEEEPQTDRQQALFLLNSVRVPSPGGQGREWDQQGAPSHTHASALHTGVCVGSG